jgi:RHH-type transcriptional regulator, proline utilization regulon repressor / proline dehydrogenase / delta 1-pyrroline-5-carboxylate dehydrogenase
MHAMTPAPARLSYPYRDEAAVVDAALAALHGLDWPAVVTAATPWVEGVRASPAPFWAMESLLREYPITSAEGLALMRLAEALLRVPDAQTAIALTADQLGRADFSDAAEGGPHRMLANLSSTAIALSKKFLPESDSAGADGGLLTRLGSKTIVAATVRAIQLLGRQFVLGRHIGEAMTEADAQRRSQPSLRFSYDMLGEGARTERDAQRYLASYQGAIAAIAKSGARGGGPEGTDGISIKLSALFARYEDTQRERVFAELVPRVATLIDAAARADMNLTVDAEESDRLELSLDVFERLAQHVAKAHPRWRGFGLAVQAYQTRALDVVDAVAGIARAQRLGFMVRLVKGAYWDGEIKRAQELGLAGYPVFTHKQHTDIAYLACARALIGHADVIYPQFASHNAATVAAILQMARAANARFEFQRLHGMGEGVFREVLAGHPTLPLRIYAPVGEHRDLLAYLVRRLLENGANSSFVHQLADDEVSPQRLLASPLARIDERSIPLPRDLYADAKDRRANATGADLACVQERAPLDAAVAAARVQAVAEATPAEVSATMARLSTGFAAWNARPAAQRAAVLRRAADALDAQRAEYCGLLVKEAHKTLGDSLAEVREAVDFLRYYANQAEQPPEPALQGRDGDLETPRGRGIDQETPRGRGIDLETPRGRGIDQETPRGRGIDQETPRGRGVFVCISPWNFPLAIFAGQVAAALVVGNSVAAKPAEQTPFVAQRFVALLHEAGVPQDALALLHGPGETVGAALVADARTAGVAFTGSTPVAKIIDQTLARTAPGGGGEPLRPLIAETGGLNVMVVDSTALPEQVVDAVVQSAFRSAGQRCSALRLLCVHESIADGVIEMVAGAMAELRLGDAAELATDVGPLIDGQAHAGVARHVERLLRSAKLVAASPRGAAGATHQVPIAFEIARIADLQDEVFAPVLQIVRWSGDVDALVDEINALGFGLTLGVQTRIDSRAERIADRARVGNVYVNRNMIGAVVGVQPFGGEGLSGTGPKAGGPHYLLRFAAASPAIGGPALPLPLRDAAPAALDAVLARARASAWHEATLDQRCRWLDRVRASSLAEQARQQLATRSLPGPTGERNELRLHGRGVVASVATAADAATQLQWQAALAAGNTLLVVLPPAAREQAEGLFTYWRRAGDLPDGAVQIVDAPFDAAVAAVAADDRVQAVIADAGFAAALRTRLAARRGAIVPLLVGDQSAALWRLAAEQTLTVNTAAAGGNAALLAGVPQ